MLRCTLFVDSMGEDYEQVEIYPPIPRAKRKLLAGSLQDQFTFFMAHQAIEDVCDEPAEPRRKHMDEDAMFLIGIIVVAVLVACVVSFLIYRNTMDDPIRARVKLEKVQACKTLENPSDRSLCLISIK